MRMMTIMTDMLPYLLIGLGMGYLVALGVTRGPSNLDYKRQDLEAKKEWLRMQGSKK